jgi:hypothetical protein
MERDEETQQIRSELAILQARYALYGRTARILKGFFIIAPLVAILTVVFAGKIFLFDWLYGGLFIGAMLLLSLGAFCISDLRWINAASLQGYSFFLSPSRIYPEEDLPQTRSDAELIELQITARERRLRELEEGSANMTE